MWERAISLIVLSGAFFFFILLTFYFRNLIHQFLSILVLMVIQGVLYLYLNAEFLAAVQVIVYAGAILIMFLFTLFLFSNEELSDKTLYFREISYLSFLPLGIFLFLFILSLFRGVPESYPSVELIPDLKEIVSPLFNEYWLAIYLLAFILSLPMVALYVFFKREESNGNN